MKPFSHLKISRLRTAAAVIALFILVLAGCTMIPKYKQPSAPVSSSWPSVPGYAQIQTTNAAVPASDIGWRDFFRDPKLQQVIELALTNNPNLLSAVYNVQESRALYHVQEAALVPTIDANASVTRQRIPNVYNGPSSTNGSTSKPLVYTEYSANVGIASYEIDLFGRVRSLRRQALETYFATQEARKAAQIALVAQVATAYLTEEEAAGQLAVSREMLKAARQSFDLTKRSFEAGVSSQFDLNNASTLLQNTSAAEATYAQQFAEARDNLTLLVGEPLPAELEPKQSLDTKTCLADIPAGLPSDLLEQRPDVMEAEHQLKATNANIGAARAELFPTITLTGNAGYASTTLANLFTPGSSAFGITPQLVWPIFDMGTAYNGLKAVRAAQRVSAENYVSTVQTAFKEVADALAVRETVQSELADDEALVRADKQSYQLTQAGFRTGVNSSLDVNVTLQTLDSARLNLVSTQYSQLISLINLYQALGGGWSENTVPSQQSAKK
jgi:outer membrane protein, multidrug efflux system